MDELEISGKRYISSRRAAKEHKYHVDYIGQLIRSGKVAGSKVGRSWYVEADSLEQYLSGESATPVLASEEAAMPMTASHAVVEQPQPKQFIAEPAYTPAVTHKVEVQTEIVEKEVADDEIREVPLAPVEDTAHTIAINKMPHVGLTYIADESPLLPEIRPTVKSTYIPYEEPEQQIEEEKVASRPQAIASRRSLVPMVVLGVVGVLILAGVAAGSVLLNSRVVLEQGKPATVEYSLQK